MQYYFRHIFLSTFLVLSLFANAATAAPDTTKIVILPFDATEAGKYAQLKDGLRSMLAGRLAANNSLEIINVILTEAEQQTVVAGEQAARQALFTRLGADYITMGRLDYSTEETISLIMTMYTATAIAPQEVRVEAEGDHQILPAVDLLVLKMVDEVMGESTDTVVTRRGTDAFQTEHPARKYKEELITGSSVSSEAGVVIARGDLQRRRSTIDGRIISMTAADLDNDGIEEIFVVTEDELQVLRYNRGLLEQLDAFAFPAALEVHAINLADRDGDGTPEIYLSAVADNRFSSQIMTWSPGESFTVTHSSIRYAIRPLQLPDGSWVLLGQARNRKSQDFLQPGVYALELDEQRDFSRGERMFLPAGVNLFDFVIVDLDGDSFPEKVVIDASLKLNVYSSSNDLLWQSETDYGGSVNYLGSHFHDDSTPPSGYIGIGDARRDGIAEGWLTYLPVRLVVGDGNNDGAVDIIAARNELATFRFLRNLRSFETGKVVCLSWTGTQMQEVWSTDALAGHVSDLYLTNVVSRSALTTSAQDAISDALHPDKSNTIRLIVGHNSGGGLGEILPLSDREDNLITYEFAISPETTEVIGEE